MRKRRFIIFGIPLIAAIGLLTFCAILPKEPSYDGRLMTDWIWSMNEKPEGPEKEAARAVVRRWGATSYPVLLEWLQEEDKPSLIARIDEVRNRVFFWLVGHKIIANRPITALQDRSVSRRAVAIFALPELDSATRQATIPTLIQVLVEKKPKVDEPSDNAGAAMLVLRKMAPEAISSLIGALTNKNYPAWAMVAGVLGEMGPDAKVAIPKISLELQNKDYRIRLSAAYNLSKLGGDPETFVPVMIALVDPLAHEPVGPDSGDLEFLLEVLVHYPDQAKPAIPILVEILNSTTNSTDPNKIVMHDDITRALEKIDVK